MRDIRFSTFILFSIIWTLNLGLPEPRLISTASASEKMKPEEVVLKHLEAIGATDARNSVTNRIIIGTCKFSFRARGVGQTEGRAVLASDGNKSLIGMEFPDADYPHERLGFDGRNFTTSYVRPGIRSILGDFLYGRNDFFREGLIGGTLNQAWPLLNLTARNPKLEYVGEQKLDGRAVHVIDYNPRKGSDFQIKLFFDGKTFQHVRSEYQQVISAGLGRTDKESASQRSSSYKIVEEFSDYRKEGGLMLPHSYKLQFLLDDRNGARQLDWMMSMAEYAFNRNIPPDSFNVETYKPGP